MAKPQPTVTIANRSWHTTQLWQQYDGEFRANMLRIISLSVFYGIHLLNYYRPFGFFELQSQPEARFHQAVTALTAAWVFMAFAVDQSLRLRFFPKWLPYATTGMDIALLTALLCLGGGHLSPLIFGYPLILILAALRFNLTLIRVATLASCFGYLFVSAAAKWPQLLTGRQIGRVPRYSQLMTLAAITISGIMLGQLIRRCQIMATWYSQRSRAGTGDE